MGGWQACKIALDNSPYLVRAASPVTYCALSWLCSLIRFRRCGTQWGFRCMYFGLPNNGMGAKSRDQQQEWARRIANLRRDRGSAGKRPEILGAVARTLGVSPAPPPFTGSRDTGCSWNSPRRPWTLPSPRVNPDAPSLLLRGLTAQFAHGNGFTIRFERAFKIRSGCIGILWAPLEYFLPECPPDWGLPLPPSLLFPLRRRSRLTCGILRPTAALLPNNGPRNHRARTAKNSLKRFRKISIGAGFDLPSNRLDPRLGRTKRPAIWMGISFRTRQMTN